MEILFFWKGDGTDVTKKLAINAGTNREKDQEAQLFFLRCRLLPLTTPPSARFTVVSGNGSFF